MLLCCRGVWIDQSSAVLMPCYLSHGKIFIHPKFLEDRSIRYSVTLQKPGQLLIVPPLVARQGFYTGNSMSINANLLDYDCLNLISNRIFPDAETITWPCCCGDIDNEHLSGWNMPTPLKSFSIQRALENGKKRNPDNEQINPFSWLKETHDLFP